MNESRDALEDRLQNYEAQLGGLKTYIKELKDKTAEHGTEREHFEEDLLEAEHNVTFYEAEVTRLKDALSQLGDGGPKPKPSPRLKKGVGALIVGLLAGALVAVGLKSRRGGKDKGN